MTRRHTVNVQEVLAGVAPITIGTENCEAALGVPWRWLRSKAPTLGVPLITLGNKTVIEVALLVEALRSAALASTPDGRTSQPERHAEAQHALLRELQLQPVVINQTRAALVDRVGRNPKGAG